MEKSGAWDPAVWYGGAGSEDIENMGKIKP